MRRGLDLDVLQCPNCGGRMRFIATILSTGAICKILKHLGLPADPVELAAARAHPAEQIDVWRQSRTEHERLEFKEAKKKFDNTKLYRY